MEQFHSRGISEIKADSYLGFVREWQDIVNRGGLVVANEEFFLLIRRIEYCVCTILNVCFSRRYRNEDLRDSIKLCIKSNKLINNALERITENIKEPLQNYLKDLVIDKWIKLRANTFVKAYIQIVRRK